ncbi:hypothetical protein [Lysobacter sp. Root690]|uniref:hypothetical protein n=1 Tax=Lysobacter sp. Root690 TaxID=1736588 RepID=UPI0012FA9F9E|nr:hypothetical protein [Lysobacter sp. Root690]
MKISQRQPRTLRARAMGGASLHRTNETRRLAADTIQQAVDVAGCRVPAGAAQRSPAARRHCRGRFCRSEDSRPRSDIPMINRRLFPPDLKPKPVRSHPPAHRHGEVKSC